jgi:hypothetical protein
MNPSSISPHPQLICHPDRSAAVVCYLSHTVIPTEAARSFSSAPPFGASGRVVEGSWHSLNGLEHSGFYTLTLLDFQLFNLLSVTGVYPDPVGAVPPFSLR